MNISIREKCFEGKSNNNSNISNVTTLEEPEEQYHNNDTITITATDEYYIPATLIFANIRNPFDHITTKTRIRQLLHTHQGRDKLFKVLLYSLRLYLWVKGVSGINNFNIISSTTAAQQLSTVERNYFTVLNARRLFRIGRFVREFVRIKATQIRCSELIYCPCQSKAMKFFLEAQMVVDILSSWILFLKCICDDVAFMSHGGLLHPSVAGRVLYYSTRLAIPGLIAAVSMNTLRLIQGIVDARKKVMVPASKVHLLNSSGTLASIGRMVTNAFLGGGSEGSIVNNMDSSPDNSKVNSNINDRNATDCDGELTSSFDLKFCTPQKHISNPSIPPRSNVACRSSEFNYAALPSWSVRNSDIVCKVTNVDKVKSPHRSGYKSFGKVRWKGEGSPIIQSTPRNQHFCPIDGQMPLGFSLGNQFSLLSTYANVDRIREHVTSTTSSIGTQSCQLSPGDSVDVLCKNPISENKWRKSQPLLSRGTNNNQLIISRECSGECDVSTVGLLRRDKAFSSGHAAQCSASFSSSFNNGNPGRSNGKATIFNTSDVNPCHDNVSFISNGEEVINEKIEDCNNSNTKVNQGDGDTQEEQVVTRHSDLHPVTYTQLLWKDFELHWVFVMQLKLMLDLYVATASILEWKSVRGQTAVFGLMSELLSVYRVWTCGR